MSAVSLTKALDEMENAPKDFFEILAAWQNGDMDNLEALMNREMPALPPCRNSLVVDGNRRWLSKAQDLARQLATLG